ncbi:MAG TPA: DUF1003 domain-containing protein [Flavobacterium sp.]|uniref:DUF1003 domain-containing protein n=1 Tax=Flavobacterium sp. TaxID=239 RepID=UPI002C8393D0|nr:DUF1003 domain-containing protein [Flavobacterium sp.]HSD14795.1 DUF1003 domain-containing protein [Flavobacterium sp.]
MKTFVSDISGEEFPISDRVYGKTIRKSIFDCIQNEYPGFNVDSLLSVEELNYFREKYISGFLLKEVSELNELEKAVITSLTNQQTVLQKPEEDSSNVTFGQRIADKVAEFGGSWTFILSFLFFLLVWICLNVFIFLNRGFDPYPFILLNLILSCIAALQAPVIMMSQNRQEEKDRQRAKNDYMVNLKSELEIRMLHEKIDHLIMHQEQSLIEFQKVQIDMLNDIIGKIEKKDS